MCCCTKAEKTELYQIPVQFWGLRYHRVSQLIVCTVVLVYGLAEGLFKKCPNQLGPHDLVKSDYTIKIPRTRIIFNVLLIAGTDSIWILND